VPGIPHDALEAIRAYCAAKIPEHLADEIRIDARPTGTSVTIFEARAPWDPAKTAWTETTVAQLRWSGPGDEWTRFCGDGDGRWHRFEPAPSGSLDDLLAEIDEDSTGIFWG
jgi:hypothetical protein